MAQTITAPLYGHFISGPGMVIPLADQTTTTAAQQFVGTGGRLIAASYVQAMISLKTFVVGTGTAYPLFTLEVADNSAFNTGRRRIAQFQPGLSEAIAAIPGAVPIFSILLEGFCPDGNKNFVRVFVTLGGTSTCVYDVIIVGA
jgi:hypothetical protein